MSLLPVRRHAIACTLHLVPAVMLYQHLLSPNMLILMARFAIQSQIATPRYVHPTATLRLWAGFVLLINGVALFLHSIDMARPGEKSMLLDFVGLRQEPSPVLVLALDTLLFSLQLLIVYVAYLCDPLPSAPDAPTVLLPAAHIPGLALDPLLPHAADDDGDVAEHWTIARRRRGRRRKSGRAYDALQREEEGGSGVVNLDDSDGEAGGKDEEDDERTSFLDSSATAKASSLSPPAASPSAIPLIFDITLRSLLSHILTLPAPAPPRRTFSGGTPIGTPSGLASRSLGSLADLNATVALDRERERERERNRGSLVHEP